MEQHNELRFCRRCLLAKAGETDLAELIKQRIEVIPAAQRTADDEYAKRLAICEACEHLNRGTCTKCGCYVELRAAKSAQHCPHENTKW